jgi:hypothetical protein
MAPKMTVAEAKAKAAEMKAAAAAKRAKKEATAAGQSLPLAVDASEAAFLLGDQSLVLIDWDDTLFPTSAWKDRIADGSNHPPRASKIATLSEAIINFIRTLQQHATVKIVTHGTKGWFAHSSSVLLPECKALLDSLDKRYRDSHGGKYMTKKPSGSKYMTDIGVEVDNYGEWFKTDMFFHFISENKRERKWDETHLPAQVTLPRQVLIIGDGHAEKRSYDEHGNQARVYASRPGHAAVANVGLKGVFLKDGPSYDELVLQLRWANAHVATTFLPADDFRTMMWDLCTSFPEWVCSIKAGANMYQPISRGSLIGHGGEGGGSDAMVSRGRGGGGLAPMDVTDEDAALQLAIAASMSQVGGGGVPPAVPSAGCGGAAGAAGAAGATTATSSAAQTPGQGAGAAPAEDKQGEADDEERAMKEAIALSLQ